MSGNQTQRKDKTMKKVKKFYGTLRSNHYVPKDYDDLYRHYFTGSDALVKAIIRRRLPYATPDESESLLHIIFIRMMEYDILTNYNPDKSNFGGLIYTIARSMIVNHLSAKGRNPITGLYGMSIVEEFVRRTNDDKNATEFSLGVARDVIASPTAYINDDNANHYRITANRIVGWAASLQGATNKRDRSLYPMLRMMIAGYEIPAIAIQLDVTYQTVSNWIKYVREYALANDLA